jgi:hypothetical protein
MRSRIASDLTRRQRERMAVLSPTALVDLAVRLGRQEFDVIVNRG